MAPQDRSKRPSKKTGTNKKRKRTPNAETKARATDKERTMPTIPKIEKENGGGRGGLDKMPSNAPTMAIAPSDYEHIFHEGPAGGGGGGGAEGRKSPIANEEGRTLNTVTPETQAKQAPASAPVPMPAPGAHPPEVQVTPDGYTLLGQPPLEVGASASSRRIALPSHIVRANNQFSRAALSRVAKYLASRAEY